VKRVLVALGGGLALSAAACSSSPVTPSVKPPASAAPTSGSAPVAPASPASPAKPAAAVAASEWQGQFTGYGDSSWRSLWGYLDQGSFGQAQLSAVRAAAPGGGLALRVLYGQGSSANSCGDCPNPGGAQFYTSLAAMGKARLATAPVLYLRYYLKFPAGFDFGRGGKLPGLYGGPIGAESGGHHGAGFSTRYMWRDHEVSGSVPGCSRSAPCAEVYLYSPRSTNGYGQDLGGQWQWQGDGRWHMVEQRVDRSTGDITVWYDGSQVLNQPGVLGDSARVPFAGIMFSTFFGGHDTSWGPSQSQYAYFADFAVGTSYIGPR
jgi:hypothetical protein